MGSLITAGGRQIIVEFPDEPVTGADMEWNFANPDDGTFFRILLQAKQCYGEGKDWRRHCYRELLHTAGSTARRQAVALCDTARAEVATYPLYIFYHPESTCTAARASGATAVTGAGLADGYAIERLVTGATTRALRTRNKSLKAIAPLLFPLSDLFCPPTVLELGPLAFAPDVSLIPMAIGREGGRTVLGVPVPPTPAAVRSRIAGRMETMRRGREPQAAEMPDMPVVANEIPTDVLNTIERAQAGRPSECDLDRWRVTFVSSSPREIDPDQAQPRQ